MIVEKQLRARRAAFVDLAIPVIIQDLLTMLVTNTVKDLVPDVDSSLVTPLLSEIIQLSTTDAEKSESAITALFVPDNTEDFVISFTSLPKTQGDDKSPTLRINGLQIPFNAKSKCKTKNQGIFVIIVRTLCL